MSVCFAGPNIWNLQHGRTLEVARHIYLWKQQVRYGHVSGESCSQHGLLQERRIHSWSQGTLLFFVVLLCFAKSSCKCNVDGGWGVKSLDVLWPGGRDGCSLCSGSNKACSWALPVWQGKWKPFICIKLDMELLIVSSLPRVFLCFVRVPFSWNFRPTATTDTVWVTLVSGNSDLIWISAYQCLWMHFM